MPDLNLKQFEAFYWIARLGSFHAAARHLRVAQPSVSARVRELERHLGIALFDRSGRNARLTPQGRELIAYAGQILSLAGEVEQRIGSRGALVGRVRIGVTSVPAVTWLPKLLRRVAKAYPGVDLEFTVDSSENMRLQLLHGELDIAFLAGPLSDPSLTTESLGAVAMAWLCSPGLALPEGPLTPADIAEVPIITDVRGSFLHQIALDWFNRGNAVPRRHHACSSLPTRLLLAREGIGVAIAPAPVAAREIAEGSLRLLVAEPDLPALNYVIAVAGGALAPPVRVVLDLARETLAAEPKFEIAALPRN
ncbi:MAG: LysR family transcriptional regulator [Rhodospirillales bacterium]|nr:LysR family transcriptional regulator [Rhodospirillales bacterium]